MRGVWEVLRGWCVCVCVGGVKKKTKKDTALFHSISFLATGRLIVERHDRERCHFAAVCIHDVIT